MSGDGIKVLIAGGGTGGHFFSGVAVGEAVLARHEDNSVVYVGTQAGIEARVGPELGLDVRYINISGIKGKGLMAKLKAVARIFQFDERDFDRIFSSHLGSDDADPYQILGVDRDAEDSEIKKAYRDLMRENHPDRLMAQGLPQEMIDVANEKVAHINDAYDRVTKMRGMK
ncbi:MAG TPA: hypothetical protein EYQ64_02160 [Gemmatimonadetes bacterium]|nr:hypothetical protein [Gemmatimonadota bacterium]